MLVHVDGEELKRVWRRALVVMRVVCCDVSGCHDGFVDCVIGVHDTIVTIYNIPHYICSCICVRDVEPASLLRVIQSFRGSGVYHVIVLSSGITIV